MNFGCIYIINKLFSTFLIIIHQVFLEKTTNCIKTPINRILLPNYPKFLIKKLYFDDKILL